jgi:hypothetical protein
MRINEAPKEAQRYFSVVTLEHPWGEAIMIFIGFYPSDGFAGGFGVDLVLGPAIKIFYDAKIFWPTLSDPIVIDKIRSMLFHELTHAVDHVSAIKDQKARSDKGTKLEELGISPNEYFNTPTEIRAYMQTLYEEIKDEVHDKTNGSLEGLGKIILIALQNNLMWKKMQPYLISANHNRILKGLVTAFEDEMI